MVQIIGEILDARRQPMQQAEERFGPDGTPYITSGMTAVLKIHYLGVPVEAPVRVVYIVDEVGLANRYDVGLSNILWGPDFPHSASNWPVDYELGKEVLERAGCTPSEIGRIMWRNAADLYKLPYDEPSPASNAA